MWRLARNSQLGPVVGQVRCSRLVTAGSCCDAQGLEDERGGLGWGHADIVVTDLAGPRWGGHPARHQHRDGAALFSQAPLALGHVVVGSSGGVIKTLKVTNLTSQNITLGALGYDRAAVDTGTGTIRFTVDTSKSTCGVGVVLGRVGESEEVTKSCDFVVTFTVSKIGAFGATLSLASTGQNRTALPAATLPFSGTGVAPLAWSPSPLALGDVVVGSSGGVTRTLKVTNLTSRTSRSVLSAMTAPPSTRARARSDSRSTRARAPVAWVSRWVASASQKRSLGAATSS